MFKRDFKLTGSSPYSGPPAARLKWKYRTGGMILSSPAIGADGTIYFGSDDTHLYALNPDGSLKWKYKTDGKI
ncbi:MAG: PQQ-binding-like beta-propeller repeat protein, partial [Thermoproteota archaeon]